MVLYTSTVMPICVEIYIIVIYEVETLSVGSMKRTAGAKGNIREEKNIFMMIFQPNILLLLVSYKLEL